jgi:hypothetical protein
MYIESVWMHRHDGAQLNKSDVCTAVDARLVLLSRVWGQDPEYLRAHGGEYENVVHEQRTTLIRELLGLGSSSKARQVIAMTRSVPIRCRLLASLPPTALRALLRANRYLHR